MTYRNAPQLMGKKGSVLMSVHAEMCCGLINTRSNSVKLFCSRLVSHCMVKQLHMGVSETAFRANTPQKIA